jgi:hypothetical protein
MKFGGGLLFNLILVVVMVIMITLLRASKIDNNIYAAISGLLVFLGYLSGKMDA